MTEDPGVSLQAALRSLGHGEEELERAHQEGTLALLALERFALGRERLYDLLEAAERSGLGQDRLGRIWRSLGFPDPRPGERTFSEADLENLRAVAGIMESGLVSEEVALQMTRVIGSSMARVAEALVDVIDARAGEAPPPEELALSAAQTAAFLPRFPAVLEQVWHRHLQGAARRRFLRGGDNEPLVVGFADLVGFTALAQQVSDEELAEVVERFSRLAHDVVHAGGGRVVKMIGDEVMFTVESPLSAAEIALGLADASRDAAGLSDVRVGLARGPVIEREGDAYGATVNLASRITAIAYPGSVVVSAEVHDVLAGQAGYSLRPMRPRTLKHIGRVALWVLRRAEEGPASIREALDQRRQQMRAVVRERLASRLDQLEGGEPSRG